MLASVKNERYGRRWVEKGRFWPTYPGRIPADREKWCLWSAGDIKTLGRGITPPPVEPGRSLQTDQQPLGAQPGLHLWLGDRKTETSTLGMDKVTSWEQINLPFGDETLAIGSGMELCWQEPVTQLRELPEAVTRAAKGLVSNSEPSSRVLHKQVCFSWKTSTSCLEAQVSHRRVPSCLAAKYQLLWYETHCTG